MLTSNHTSEINIKQVEKKIVKNGMIGCLNESGVTANNYKSKVQVDPMGL